MADNGAVVESGGHVAPGDRAWRVIAAIALIALGSSLGLNVVLWQRLGHTPDQPITTERLQPGTQLLPFDARTTTGDRQQLTASASRPKVLYFFSTSCGWCERNWANVRALEAATRATYDFVAISNSIDTAEFAHERKLPFKVLTGVSPDVLRRHHIGGTPRTIVVSRGGQVIRDWIGAYTPETLKEIESFFSVELPGLANRELASTDGGQVTSR